MIHYPTLSQKIFLYAQNSDDRECDPWYFECLDTFLSFVSYRQNDESIYPYWSKEVDLNSIVELILNTEKRFIKDIMSYYINNRESLWEFTKNFPWTKKNNLIAICLGHEEKQIFINAMFARSVMFSYSGNEQKSIEEFFEYIEKLSNCSSFNKYIVSKYELKV